jgi:biopolymer transport protein ExbD
MAMSIAFTDDSGSIAEMNTTPLIDVLLVLLIMFIVTLPLMTHTTTLNLAGRPGVPAKVIEIDIDRDGTIAWNGTAVTDFAQLEQYFRAERASGADAEVRVRPDDRTRYDTVVKVLASAQRNGLRRIGVVN